MRAILAAILVLFGAPTAWAQGALELGEPTQGYTYFNRLGATAEDHSRDIRACASLAVDLELPRSVPTAGLVPYLMSLGPARAVFVSGVENCMVVRGWRVYRLPASEGEVYSNLQAPEVAATIAPWIGSDNPHGQFARAWDNDAALAATDRYASRPSSVSRGSLSLLAEGELEIASPIRSERARFDRRWPRRPLRPDAFASAPADGAIVIFNITDVSIRNGIGFVFRRQGSGSAPFPSMVDAAPDEVEIYVPLIQFRREGNWRAFALPAGRWRLSSMGILPVLNLCLGAPSFEVAAGEVVFAGSFDFNAERFSPDLSLDAVRSWLSEAPEAARVRAAEYSNGWTGPCGDNAMYAIEFDGAPFAPGYAYGGAPRVAPSAESPLSSNPPGQ